MDAKQDETIALSNAVLRRVLSEVNIITLVPPERGRHGCLIHVGNALDSNRLLLRASKPVPTINASINYGLDFLLKKGTSCRVPLGHKDDMVPVVFIAGCSMKRAVPLFFPQSCIPTNRVAAGRLLFIHKRGHFTSRGINAFSRFAEFPPSRDRLTILSSLGQTAR